MLDLYQPNPYHPWWQRMLLPFFYKDQLKMIGLPIVGILISAMLINDIVVLLPAMGVLYFAFVLSMRKMIPYKVNISPGDVDVVATALDRTSVLQRFGSQMTWRRKVAFHWMESKLDIIRITKADSHFVVTGRKHDIAVLLKHLDEAKHGLAN